MKIWHIETEETSRSQRDLRLDIMMGSRISNDGADSFKKAVREAFQKGLYLHVATINDESYQDKGAAEHAYVLTQNGVRTDSWSQEPVGGLIPSVPSFHLIDGEKFGRRSSMVGDLFEDDDGTFYACDLIGFALIEELRNV